ncbi:MAG: ATP-binding cassette domain-containing protein [Pseudomonadota bacterium]
MTEFFAGLPSGLDTMAGGGGIRESSGQRQRIGIARALYREPALLILDDVTSALDELAEAAVMSELLELRGQTSMLLVTHRLPTVALADCVYRLDSGRAAVAASLSDTAE